MKKDRSNCDEVTSLSRESPVVGVTTLDFFLCVFNGDPAERHYRVVMSKRRVYFGSRHRVGMNFTSCLQTYSRGENEAVLRLRLSFFRQRRRTDQPERFYPFPIWARGRLSSRCTSHDDARITIFAAVINTICRIHYCTQTSNIYAVTRN